MKEFPPDEQGSHGRRERPTALAVQRRTPLAHEMVLAAGPAGDPEQPLQLRDLLRIFLKRKWTILAVFTISAIFAVVLTYLAPPVYRATTTIQIERFAPRVFDYKDVSQSESIDYDSQDFYNTAYELLKSRAVTERAVEDLGMRKQGGAPAAAETPAKPAEERAPVHLVHDFFNRLRGAAPPVEIDPAVREDNAVVGAFQGSVNVEPVRRSRLVRVHFDSTDPFFAAKAVNVLAQAFINVNLERRYEASAYAKTFLEEKLLQTKARLEDSERELVRFSRELEIINIDEKQNVFSQNLQEYNTALAKAEQERIRAEVLHRQAQDNPESLVMLQRENRDFQAFQALKLSRAKLEAEYQEGLKVYKPAFPKMLALQGQIVEIDNQIRKELDEIRNSATATFRASKAQEELLRAKLGKAKQEMLDLQGRTIRYSILKREVDTNRSLYDGLLQRLKEVGVAGGATINNISVVDKAQVPLFPYKPNLRGNLSLGMMIGLMLGLMVAWLLEHLDDSIRFVEDVERETNAPVLGVVPMLKGVEVGKSSTLALGPHTEPTSAFAEAYRSVRTALQFSTPSGAPRRLVVTSSSKNEGKSTTALALAINFAQMGKPVLLIDADLRNPVLHKLLKTTNKSGLSNYLSGSMGALEVTRPTEIPHLFVMTTGPLPPNPVELLSSIKLLNLLSQCEEHFAHVIVDGPPVLGIADAIVLCNQVENSVFVVESGRTRKAQAKAAIKRLRQAGVNPLGVILTKIDAYHDLYGYHSYYYQYAAAQPPAGTRKEVTET
jgi:succinoglycan biosynthesis transport protein ExoP